MSEPMPDLDAIRARHSDATEGPWWFDESEDCWRLHGIGGWISGPFERAPVSKQILKAPKHGTPYAEYWPDKADGEFIAHAWQDVGTLLAEVKRLNRVVQLLGSELQRDSMKVIDQLKHEPCLPIEHVERFLKRERDEHDKGSLAWRDLDDVLDAFRLHMVTGTPLTEPRPTGGPEAPFVGEEPGTEAEELRSEVERLRAALEEIASRTVQRDLSRIARTALTTTGEGER